MTLNTLALFEKHHNTFLPTPEEEDSEQQTQWLRGKTVLLRVDFNVPLSKSLQITDDNRITAAHTNNYLVEGTWCGSGSHVPFGSSKRNKEQSIVAPASR